jgi:hypothetical protein
MSDPGHLNLPLLLPNDMLTLQMHDQDSNKHWDKFRACKQAKTLGGMGRGPST